MTDTDWQTRAACRGMDTEIFFSRAAANRDLATRTCLNCPVTPECDQEAERDTGYRTSGIWAAKPRTETGRTEERGHDPATRTEATRLYREHRTSYSTDYGCAAAIGKQLGVDPTTIMKWVRAVGLARPTIRPGQYDAEFRTRVIDAYRAERPAHRTRAATAAAIAERFGISAGSVKTWAAADDTDRTADTPAEAA